MTKKLKIIIMICIIAIAVLVLFSPYLKAKYLTTKYGDEFKNGYAQTGFIDDVEYFRVIDYSKDSAKVFYVTKKHATGDLIEFKKSNDGWEKESWKTVWSKTGSADSFMWPYYR